MLLLGLSYCHWPETIVFIDEGAVGSKKESRC